MSENKNLSNLNRSYAMIVALSILRKTILHTSMNKLFNDRVALIAKRNEESKELLQACRDLIKVNSNEWDDVKHLIDHVNEELGDLLVMQMLVFANNIDPVIRTRYDVNREWSIDQYWTLFCTAVAYFKKFIQRHEQIMSNPKLDYLPSTCYFAVINAINKAVVRHAGIGDVK